MKQFSYRHCTVLRSKRHTTFWFSFSGISFCFLQEINFWGSDKLCIVYRTDLLFPLTLRKGHDSHRLWFWQWDVFSLSLGKWSCSSVQLPPRDGIRLHVICVQNLLRASAVIFAPPVSSLNSIGWPWSLSIVSILFCIWLWLSFCRRPDSVIGELFIWRSYQGNKSVLYRICCVDKQKSLCESHVAIGNTTT